MACVPVLLALVVVQQVLLTIGMSSNFEVISLQIVYVYNKS